MLPVELMREPGRPVAVSMDQSPPRFGQSVGDHAELAASLGLDEDAIPAARVLAEGGAIVTLADIASAPLTAAVDAVSSRGHFRREPGHDLIRRSLELNLTGTLATIRAAMIPIT